MPLYVVPLLTDDAANYPSIFGDKEESGKMLPKRLVTCSEAVFPRLGVSTGEENAAVIERLSIVRMSAALMSSKSVSSICLPMAVMLSGFPVPAMLSGVLVEGESDKVLGSEAESAAETNVCGSRSTNSTENGVSGPLLSIAEAVNTERNAK